MNQWYCIIPFGFATFTVFYGVLVPYFLAANVRNLNVATDVNNMIEIQAHEVVDQESELDKEIRLLEKQKRIAKLKKEIKGMETVELSTSKNLVANPS
ncbi:20619_t:CDS:2 [Gigaspora margarita]|uniref:20619_t:CDS:1 n=1 Tax=Gigaspora margarita TaxID=4874 RepID=A0ABN7V3C2_GIGMA|nr:20619_t:CDS:2 [Gigaspora margarita]